ncbi:MAG: hypothetical protein OEZ41_13930 [Nitrospirota bacterium]|nr:hypothetical protein [Nitrospirota bacterium]
MTQLRKDLQGRGPVQTFSRSGVQPMSDGIQFALGVARQVRALGQILAHQAIGVLIGPVLPGLCGSAKNTWMASRCAKRSCSAISLPRSSGSVLRSGAIVLSECP